MTHIDSIRRSDFDDALLRDLHALADRLMAERFEHFRVHAMSNDAVHVFRDGDRVVGFQFWRTVPLDAPRTRAIVGGKLRILPEYRRRALHLRSGLLFFLQEKRRRPLDTLYRLSIASIFGFVSITEALAEYHLFDGSSPPVIARAFRAIAEQSHYREEGGRFFVDIYMTDATLARYPESYFARPAARLYAEKNREYRTNGTYLGFWFRFTPRNLVSLSRAIWRRR